MYDHRRAASWSDTPNGFPEITPSPSQRAKHGRSGRKVLSQFLSPSSVSKQPMHVLSKAPASTLYDDPAFSPDPRTHPYFAANTTPWATPFQLKSGLNGQTSLPFHTASSSIPDIDDSQLLQQPSTPMFSDDHSSTTHETNSSSNHTSTTSTSFSSPPTSTDSHSLPWMPALSEKAAQPLPWPPETQKKKINLAMFWRKTPPETVLESVDLSRPVLSDPPSSSLPPITRPTAARFITAPEAIKLVDRPILPPRSVTTAADSKPPPTASRRIIGGVPIRAHELDRIDELDESNPVGLPLHHRGPYEAIAAAQKLTSQELQEETTPHNIPHNIGSQYQLNSPAASKHRPNRNKPQKYKGPISVPIIPAGVSLQLEPGQILPRNFYHHLDQTPAYDVGISRVPGWPSQSQSGTHYDVHEFNQTFQWQAETQNLAYNPNPLYPDTSQRPSRHLNAPPDYTEYTEYMTDVSVLNDCSSTAVKGQSLVTEYAREKHDGTYDDLKRSKRHSNIESSQYQKSPANGNYPPSDFHAPTPVHRHTPSNPRLPPRMQALQMQNARPDESHRRSPRPHNTPKDHRGSFIETTFDQTVHRRKSFGSGLVPSTPHMDTQQIPVSINSHGFSAPNTMFDQQSLLYKNTQNPQQRDLDTRSSHQSITSASNSTNSEHSRMIPPPSHAPKRLVMPTPLQQSQTLISRHHYEPPGHTDFYNWQPHLRSSSDISLAANAQMVKDTGTAQSRKLRKRNSVQGVSPQTQTPLISPSQPLTFEPTSLYISALPSQHELASRKPEKTPKNVLSKRRTGV